MDRNLDYLTDRRFLMISSEDVKAYHEQGYIVVENVIGSDVLTKAREVIAKLIEDAREVTDHNAVYDLEPAHSKKEPRIRRIKQPHRVDPVFREIMETPALIQILSRLLGPDIRVQNSKLNLKAPYYGSPVEWHQDWAFYPHTNEDVLAVGVMMDDCTLESAPLLVIPGSHKGPLYDHHADGYFCGAMDPEKCAVDFDKAVPLVGKAGSVSIHHARLVHGSAQNTSPYPRRLLLYEFLAADAWPLMGVTDLEEFNSRMVSGSPTIEPRLVNVPVRMPLPPAPRQGSIYENQTLLKNRFFEAKAI
jgi:ectoine hydroxylase-related dioxygenase (phytanoyl-CoA dioxygenase family)